MAPAKLSIREAGQRRRVRDLSMTPHRTVVVDKRSQSAILPIGTIDAGDPIMIEYWQGELYAGLKQWVTSLLHSGLGSDRVCLSSGPARNGLGSSLIKRFVTPASSTHTF